MGTEFVQRVRKAVFIRLLRWKHAVYSLHRTQIVIFSIFHVWTVRLLSVTGTNLGERKHTEFRVCAVRVPNVRLALVCRSSSVYIHTWKNAHIF